MHQDSKDAIYFYMRQLEMPKITFQICDAITFAWFVGHCTAKNKDIALKFCMHVVCMHSNHIYVGIWDYTKILDFIGNYFWEKNEFLGSK